MTAQDTSLQNTSISQLYKEAETLPSVPAAPYLSETVECDDKVLECAMGPLGPRLRDLASKIDFDHPEIGQVMKGIFSDSSLSEKISQYLKLARYAVDSGLDKIQLSRAALTKIPSQLRSLDSPENNQQLIRLLLDRELRDRVRLTKTPRPVEMKYLLRKGKFRWGQVPTDFSYYIRFSEAYKEDLQKLQEKVGTYQSLGCTVLSAEVENKVTSFSSHMEDTYCGFHRIKMTDAAAILGKAAGASHRMNPYRDGTSIISLPGVVAQAYLYQESGLSSAKPAKNYRYMPRAYPFAALEDIATANVKRAIDHLEKMPENNGKPLFDHYIVIVPSVDYPPEANHLTINEVKYAIRHSGKTNSFTDREECAVHLDRLMIQNGDVSPVILGERDGVCYFICYWV